VFISAMQEYLSKLTNACDRYEKTAPTVHAHCDDLYIRISERPYLVSLGELVEVSHLWGSNDEDWLPPNAAANRIYHLRESLGMPTVGHAGF
jgi:hypothetical protein